MKKLLLATVSVLLLLSSCGGHGPSNKYLGHIPTLEYERNNAWEDKSKIYWDMDKRKKCRKLIEKEEKKLEGVRIPCVSHNPDYYEIVGDNAVFHDGMYNVMLRFRKPVSVESMSNFTTLRYTVRFMNLEEDLVLGEEDQIFKWGYEASSFSAGDCIVKFSNGDCIVQEIAIYPDRVLGETWEEGLRLLQKKTNAFAIYFKDDDIRFDRLSRNNKNAVQSQEEINFYQENGFDKSLLKVIQDKKPKPGQM